MEQRDASSIPAAELLMTEEGFREKARVAGERAGSIERFNFNLGGIRTAWMPRAVEDTRRRTEGEVLAQYGLRQRTWQEELAA